MPKNNLLTNKLDKTKRVSISAELHRIIASNGLALFDIKLDNFGESLKKDTSEDTERDFLVQVDIFYELLAHFQNFELQFSHKLFQEKCPTSFFDATLIPDIPFTTSVRKRNNKLVCDAVRTCGKKLMQLYIRNQGPKSEQRLNDALKVRLCMNKTLIGSLQASLDIENKQDLSDEAFRWLILGMECTKVASAHLKLASILFLIGDLDSAKILLDDVEKKFKGSNVVHHCPCSQFSTVRWPIRTIPQILSKHSFVEVLRDDVAQCVVFLPEEINCCPKELQYEIYRSTFNKKPERFDQFSIWRYFTSIPQLPFLYFLEYKYYKSLEMGTKCNQSLKNLMNIKLFKRLCLKHLDTVFNLIGQCLEQEGHYDLALIAYYRSLHIEPVDNAARILICCYLNKQLNEGVQHI
ncbi:hypothetical protein ACF0H5_021707 [Mactra antiquata]